MRRQPRTYIAGLQFMHCQFHLFVSQCVDNRIQYRCENCREHRKDFIHWEVAERPGIDEDTGPKKEGNNNDVGSHRKFKLKVKEKFKIYSIFQTPGFKEDAKYVFPKYAIS